MWNILNEMLRKAIRLWFLDLLGIVALFAFIDDIASRLDLVKFIANIVLCILILIWGIVLVCLSLRSPCRARFSSSDRWATTTLTIIFTLSTGWYTVSYKEVLKTAPQRLEVSVTSITNSVISGAEVSLVVAGHNPMYQPTDMNGIARFEIPPDLTSALGQVSVKALGYRPDGLNVILAEDGPEVTIRLSPLE